MEPKIKLPKGYAYYTDKAGKIHYQYRFMVDGVRKSLSCKYNPLTEPDKSYEEVREWKYRLEHPDEFKQTIKLPDFVKKFNINSTFAFALEQYVVFYWNIAKKGNNRSEVLTRPSSETVRVAKDNVKLIERYPIGKKKLKDITSSDVQDFLFDLAYKYTYTKANKEYRYGKNTCNKVYFLIKGFAYEMGLEKDIFKDVKKVLPDDDTESLHIKPQKPEETYFGEFEIERLKAALFETYKNGKRILGEETSDAFFIMLDCGLRPEEVRGLKKKDADFNEKSLFIERAIPRGQKSNLKITKNKYRDKVFLSDEAMEIIRKHYIKTINPEDFLFKTTTRNHKDYKRNPTNPNLHMPMSYRSLYQTVKRAAERAEITGKRSIYPYMARHTVVNEAYETTKDIFTAQQVARHRSPKTTEEAYIHPKSNLAEQYRNQRTQQN